MRIYPLQPALVPEEQASGITVGMRFSVTPYIHQMNSIADAPHIPRQNVVAGLVRALEYPESLPAIGKHFRHERHVVKRPVGIQCCQDFFLAAHLDNFARKKSQLRIGAGPEHFYWFSLSLRNPKNVKMILSRYSVKDCAAPPELLSEAGA